MLMPVTMGKTTDLVEQTVYETLTYYGFPDIHWQKSRTNNPLERIMKEIRRRTRVVGAFPDGQSCLNLVAALPRRNNVVGQMLHEYAATLSAAPI
jgi:transposase-like protein